MPGKSFSPARILRIKLARSSSLTDTPRYPFARNSPRVFARSIFLIRILTGKKKTYEQWFLSTTKKAPEVRPKVARGRREAPLPRYKEPSVRALKRATHPALSVALFRVEMRERHDPGAARFALAPGLPSLTASRFVPNSVCKSERGVAQELTLHASCRVPVLSTPLLEAFPDAREQRVQPGYEAWVKRPYKPEPRSPAVLWLHCGPHQGSCFPDRDGDECTRQFWRTD